MPDVIINGIRFNVLEHGAGPHLILLHGFTGSSQTWEPSAGSLKQTYRVVTIDTIGHGASDAPRDPARYAFATALDDLSCLAAELGIEHAAWLGYSMGGRLALGLALRHPERVSALILESASPGIADPLDRDQRRRADEALADRIEQHGVEAFIADWERLPMWQSQSRLSTEAVQRQRAIRSGNSAAGLAGSLRGLGPGAQPSFWDELPAVGMPTLVMAGARDDKFTRIARQMADAMPRAEFVVVPNAGHAVHLEQPAQFEEIIRCFLSRN